MKIYIVQKGDTLWEIAKANNVDFEEIIKLNPQLASPDMIMPGMKIKIPSTFKQVKTNRVHENTQQPNKNVRIEPNQENAQSGNRPMAKEISDVNIGNFPQQVMSQNHIPEFPIGRVDQGQKVSTEEKHNDRSKEKLPEVESIGNQDTFTKVNINDKQMKLPVKHNTVSKQQQMSPKMKEMNKTGMARPQMMQPQMSQPQMSQPQMSQPQMPQPQMVQPQMMQPQMVQSQMMQPRMMHHHYGYCCCCSQPINRPDSRFMSFPYQRRGSFFSGGPFGPSYSFNKSGQRNC